MTAPLYSEYDTKTIQVLVHLFAHGQLNLDPGFQRESVWTDSDRRKLVESIFQNYPIPSIFLYKQSQDGRLAYDVIDGKQRLEAIFMFMGIGRFRGHRYSVKLPIDDGEGVAGWDWGRVRRKGREHQFMGYKIQTVEISGEFLDIIDLFVRINSTGKKLTGAEKRHAKYYHSNFLRKAGQLAESRRGYFESNHVLSRGQMSRMKHVELVCELLASIYEGTPINRKTALDAIIRGHSVDQRSFRRCIREFVRTLNLVKRIFPALKTTRFSKISDFYSLFMLVWEMDRFGCVLGDKKRNSQAQELLVRVSDGVGIVREQVKHAEGASPDQRLFADYLLTVQGQTDSQSNRKRRGEILRQLLGGLFERKDDRRGFTLEQRRLIWHSDEKRTCARCHTPLTWGNFTIDHVKPYSRGGRTIISNAALLCRPCNARKGNR